MNSLAWSLVKIPAAKYAEMQSHVRGQFPEEACGLLAGAITENEILVHTVLPVENQLHSPVRFRMEPYDQLKALNWIDEQGYTLVGIFHSHPNGPHLPSQTDLAEAFYPEAAYLIWYKLPASGEPREETALSRGKASGKTDSLLTGSSPAGCFARSVSLDGLQERVKHLDSSLAPLPQNDTGGDTWKCRAFRISHGGFEEVKYDLVGDKPDRS